MGPFLKLKIAKPRKPKLRNFMLGLGMACVVAPTYVSWRMEEYSNRVLQNHPSYQQLVIVDHLYTDIRQAHALLNEENPASASQARSHLIKAMLITNETSLDTKLEQLYNSIPESGTRTPELRKAHEDIFKDTELVVGATRKQYQDEVDPMMLQWGAWQVSYLLLMTAQLPLAFAFYKRRD